MNKQVQIGCQGWLYTDWTTRAGGASVFYPAGTRAPDTLEFYARAFTSVEVDSTFYAIPSQATIETWARRTPSTFTFSPKLLQEITHTHALAGAQSARLLQEFSERLRVLGERLGVVLIQLPPQFMQTPESVRSLVKFLPQLPADIRWSIEFRSYDWMEEETAQLLAEHNVAPTLVEGHWIRRESLFELFERAGTKFAYVRWMGKRDLTRFDTVQRAQNANLRMWAEKLKELQARGIEVFAYFSNYYEGFAPLSALKLQRLIYGESFDPRELEDQLSLF